MKQDLLGLRGLTSSQIMGILDKAAEMKKVVLSNSC